MAIANGTCVSFCYQPKAHYLATSRESRRYVVAYSWFAGAACRHLATSRESKAHFCLPWVRPWDYRRKCYMDGKRIKCSSNALQHVPIHLQPFPRYSEILVEICNFFIPALHLTPPYGVAPGTIAVNVIRMEREFNACQTHCSMYPSIFNRFPVIKPVSSKVRRFSTFFAHFGLPWVRPWYNRGKCHTIVKDDSMLVKRLAAYTHLSSTVSEI